MSSIQKFEDIEAWKLARALANRIYDVTSKSDFSRNFGLRDQIRRASISIVSNIAEGFGEVRAQLYLAHNRKYLSEEEFGDLTQKALQLSRVIAGLVKYLRQSQITGKKYKVVGQSNFLRLATVRPETFVRS